MEVVTEQHGNLRRDGFVFPLGTAGPSPGVVITEGRSDFVWGRGGKDGHLVKYTGL